MNKMKIVLYLSVALAISGLMFASYHWADAYVPYNEVPTEPIVDFNLNTPDIAFIQNDYCFNLTAFDDRSDYHQSYDPSIGLLNKAFVEVEIFPANKYDVIDQFNGTTSKRGYFSACDFVTTNQYNTHGLYNMTMSVSYENSTLTKEIQFWTVNRY